MLSGLLLPDRLRIVGSSVAVNIHSKTAKEQSNTGHDALNNLYGRYITFRTIENIRSDYSLAVQKLP